MSLCLDCLFVRHTRFPLPHRFGGCPFSPRAPQSLPANQYVSSCFCFFRQQHHLIHSTALQGRDLDRLRGDKYRFDVSDDRRERNRIDPSRVAVAGHHTNSGRCLMVGSVGRTQRGHAIHVHLQLQHPIRAFVFGHGSTTGFVLRAHARICACERWRQHYQRRCSVCAWQTNWR